MTVLGFLKANAMQVAGVVQVIIGGVLLFAHLTSAQTAYLGTLPSGVGTFLAGLVITVRQNGSAKPPAP